MGYRITYEKQEKGKIPRKKIVLIMVGTIIAALLLWPAGRSCLRELILPGDAEVTAEAFQGLAEDLGEGESLGDAITAFCKEIIANGQ